MTQVKYSELSLIKGKLTDKTIHLNVKVAFSELCEHEIKHAETLVDWYDGKLKIIQGKASLYIQFIDMPHFNVIEKIFIA